MTAITVQVLSGSGRIQIVSLKPADPGFKKDSPVYLGCAENAWVRLDGTTIAEHHLALSLTDEGWTIIALTPVGTPTLDGYFLSPNVKRRVHDHSILRVGGYELRFFLIPDTLPEEDTRAIISRLELVAPPAVTQRWFEAEITGLPDAGIVPGESATIQVTITNCGPRLAEFKIKIVDLSNILSGQPSTFRYSQKVPARISISPDDPTKVVSITLTPDRSLETRAGAYTFKVAVSAPGYYNEDVALCQGSLTILPFYEFVLDKQYPLYVEKPWHTEEILFERGFYLTNKGNIEGRFRLTGQDQADECIFAFQVARKNGTSLVERVERAAPDSDTILVKPGERVEILPRIMPRPNPVLLRKKDLPFTITITPQEGQQLAAIVTGRVVRQPLVGCCLVFSLGLLLLPLCVWLMLWPHILSFKADGWVANLPDKQEEEPVTLEWWVWPPFSRVSLTPDIGLIPDEPTGSRQVTADTTKTYALQADNLFCYLINSYLPRTCVVTDTITISVTPIPPRIEQFWVSPDRITQGQEVKIQYQFEDAQLAALIINGTPEPLPTEAHRGEKTIKPVQDTRIVGWVQRHTLTMTQEVQVVVSAPTSTATPTPQVETFGVSDPQVSAGEPVTFNVAVKTGDKLFLEPGGIPVPPNGSFSVMPSGSTTYQLVSVDAQGKSTVLGQQQVIVESPTSTPTATPTPAPPTIIEFKASETTLSSDDEDDRDSIVTLFWTVEGTLTDLQLLNEQGIPLQTNLPPVSQTDVLVSKDNNVFILAAYNGQQSARRSVSINIEEALVIYSFRAEFVDTNRNIIATCSTKWENNEDGYEECNVITGTTTINLKWKVKGATEVKLRQAPETAKAFSYYLGPEDSYTLPDQRSNGNVAGEYTLIVKNETDELKRKLKLDCSGPVAGLCPN